MLKMPDIPDVPSIVDFFRSYSYLARILMSSGVALIVIGILILILTPVLAQRQTIVGTGDRNVDYGAEITSPRSEQGSPFTVIVNVNENAVEAMSATIPEERIQFWYVTTNFEGDKYWPQAFLNEKTGPPWTIEIDWPLDGYPQLLATVILFAADERAQLALNLRKRGDIAHLTKEEVYKMAGMEELDRVSITIKEGL